MILNWFNFFFTFSKKNWTTGVNRLELIADFNSLSHNLLAPSEAFVIPFDDNGTNGLIKKHPPKRLQRLEEQSNTLAPPTIEDLEEKLATAELRRKEVGNYSLFFSRLFNCPFKKFYKSTCLSTIFVNNCVFNTIRPYTSRI